MLINIHHGNAAEHRRLLICGVLFLAMLIGLLSLSIAIYQKVFEPVTMVTVKADRAGLQLAKFGDVRFHGALVGQVRGIEQDGEEASIKVGLKPEAARMIPANARVEIIPTTLFGQKFIAFIAPEEAAEGSMSDGAVIPSERVQTNVELSRILADLFPLLRAVQPADLNATLNALATALQGRGADLQETLLDLDDYIGDIEDHLPTLREDLILLADVAETYAIAAPDLIEVLKDVTVTSKTVVEKQADLAAFFGDLTGMAVTATRVLGDNGPALIRAMEVTEPVLDLLAVYSPEFPCLLEGLDIYDDRLGDMFSGDRVKQYIELGATQFEGYKPEDRPIFGEVGHGPWCAGLPNPPVPYPPGIRLKDGDNRSLDTSPTALLQNPARLLDLLGLSQASTAADGGTGTITDVNMGYVGTDADRQLTSMLLAAESGTDAQAFGSLAPLYYGPLLRGVAG
ncbi:MCE family protein [Nocardioides sp. AE5]|uniref:MCE family protein n=1 Tax=Nocardioides sp. AE5 TaxID=2962573 RepID=UPI002881D520|nr:MCE family protein [Nocardioides sp. AE5]MDT0201422.1 MCE family protein [Nocardioides sp. AE5]